MMKSIKEILREGPKVSNWKGSEKTRDMIADQIRERWGETEVKNYDPNKNALPFSTWVSLGWRVKKGETALKSITVIEKKDAQGNIIKKHVRKINLFYYRSVERITN